MKLAVGITSLLLATLTHGQTQVDAILIAARDQMSVQNDAWFEDGDFLPVIQNQEAIVRIFPSDEETWSSLIWMYFNVEKSAERWVASRNFATANPDYSDRSYYEAEMFFLARLYAKVPGLIEPSLNLAKRPDANMYRILANSYYKLGYYEDAVRVWDALLKFLPGDGQAKANRDKAAKHLK
ncbi:MAG: hypothetical protein JNM34_07960 [Chthonomonadaceae bacterium]|nr:hypothetical protein [Chthonomonadaceae bacterium]